MNGTIFDIQRFSTHDGPGIRTTVFMKGCSMRCKWCHNPESIHPNPEIQFFPGKCIGCGRCFQVCPVGAHHITDNKRIFDRVKCIRCGKCADICCAEALTLTGKLMSVPEVLSEIEKDRPFFENSNGGVTFSGGEPVLQEDFLKELLMECKKRGIHTAVETAGNVPWENLSGIIPFTDLFLYDLKAMDAELHLKWTGTDNKRILNNLKSLSDEGAEICIRIPVIPGVNDTYENMKATAVFVKTLKDIRQVELIPFHKMASGKYESLGMDYPCMDLDPPGEKELSSLAAILEDEGIRAVIS